MEITFDEIKSTITEELSKFKQLYRQEFVSFEPLLGNVAEYLLAGEGKLLRPIIILLSAKLNGEPTNKTYIVAKAVEMLHTATLIHDDIVDNAKIRRGIPSVQSQWTPQIAVLVGDYLLAKSLDIITQNEIYDVLPIATNVVKTLSEGELFQIQKSLTLDTTEDEYLKIINKKTASLICACTRFGATSVDADNSVVEQMIEIGRNIGIAFQIRDDIFDFEKENKSGKAYGHELREHKLTLPLIAALRNATTSEQETIIEKLSICAENPQFIDEIIDFTFKYGGIAYAEEKMKIFSQKAIDLLETFPENEARKSLILLAKYTATRKN